MTEKQLVVHDPNESLTLQKVSEGLFASGLFPNAKNKYGAFAIIQYGRELGIPPMMSLKNINIISGQLACNAQLMLTLALQKGVTYEVIKESDKGATIKFKRGTSVYESSFTEEDAKAAGLIGKDNWKKYARDMYFWRCVAKGIRRVAPDAVMGLYTADEITEGAVIEVTDAPKKGEFTPVKDEVIEAIPVEKTEDRDASELAIISEKQRKRLFAIAKEAGWPMEELKAYLTDIYDITSSKDIPVDMYEQIIAWVECHTGYTEVVNG